MKKIKGILLTIILAVSLCAFSVYASQTLNSLTFSSSKGNVTNSSGTYTLTLEGDDGTAKMTADITSIVREKLGNDDGKISVKCSAYITGESEKRVTMALAGQSSGNSVDENGKTLTVSDVHVSSGDTIKLEFSFDASGVTQFRVKNITLSIENSVTPTPTNVQTPTPTPTKTATHHTPTPTAKPTPTAMTGPEKTNDSYNNNKVTNAPPTPSTNIDNIEDIATPIPGDENTPTPVPEKKGMSSKTGLIILFAVLITLLAADIAVIFIRKKYFGADNDNVHRTVKDFYDYGEFDPDMKTDDSYNNDLGDDEQYDDTDNENDENDDE